MNLAQVALTELDGIQRHINEARNHAKSAVMHPLLFMFASSAEQRELQDICDRLGVLSFDLASREVRLAISSK
jgi:hypothetical protein